MKGTNNTISTPHCVQLISPLAMMNKICQSSNHYSLIKTYTFKHLNQLCCQHFDKAT
ncbi:hypothetical protein Hanom_Chr06g00501921 [Helianthus anomalus]